MRLHGLFWATLVGCSGSSGETTSTETDTADTTETAAPETDLETDPVETDVPDTDVSDTDTDLPDPEEYSVPEVIASTPGNAKTAAVAVTADGRVHVVWHDFSTDPANLYHAIRENGEWTTEPLALLADKSIRPFLLAEGNTLDLAFDAHPDDVTTEIWSARYEDAEWDEPVLVDSGEKVVLARDSEDRLHALYYQQGWPTHSIRENGAWETGGEIELQDEYVNFFGMALAGFGDGVVAGVSTSDGEGFHDIQRLEWDGIGWAESTLFESEGYSSDEPELVNGGEYLHWTWTEQAQFGPYDIGIVWTLDGDPPLYVSLESGFSTDPTLAVPPDGEPVVAWVTPNWGIALDRYPFDEAIDIAPEGTGPKLTVDGDGFVHLVYYAFNGNNQDIWYSTNRPN